MGRACGVALLLSVALCAPARAVDRPPQFVVMSFDNCTELDRWTELRDFAAELDKSGARVRFTYFVTGLNFIADANRNIYEGPRHKRGASTLDFGGTRDDVRTRIALANEAYRQGHEIASHAVGHWDGRSWSPAEWTREFHSFDDVMANVGKNNGMPDAAFTFPLPIKGFRAPYLQPGPGQYPALKSGGFRYDATDNGTAEEWPQKIDGVWRYKLALIKIRALGKRVLSMDYNFFVAQSHGVVVTDQKRRAEIRDQMVDTYLDYFKANYSGNRAPLHIGHHFLDYGAGIYREALKKFARLVCGLPEVRCDTYAKLTDFIDQQSAETLAAYRKGDFPRAAEPALSVATLGR
jgi:peptidoglycan/xylan/chitin deacetylase (PgdA/CDA1 family)